MKHIVPFTPLVLLALSAAPADDAAPNRPTVVASRDGLCHANSVPADAYGERGTTEVFRLDGYSDTLVDIYFWFAQELYVNCEGAPDQQAPVSVVRLGPSSLGDSADGATQAISFYLDGQLLRRYSTLDIAGTPRNVLATKDHYTVFDRVVGWVGNHHFAVRTVDGRTLVFNTATGAMVNDWKIER